MDRKLNNLWISEPVFAGTFKKINFEEKMIFRSSKSNEFNYIDSNTGRILSENEFQNIYKISKREGELWNYRNKSINLYNSISITKNNGTIHLQREVK